MEREAVVAADPEVLPVLPCGFSPERILRERELLTGACSAPDPQGPARRRLPAVRVRRGAQRRAAR
ncbi:hypothetical protein [Streptomyces erythrochromogenes]|uniref:hypothetical protein n=1 Tax=Streptomyces erythrochromogenes TaxID=285574 RepID=UPI0036A4CA09